jgi:hypothetical protein
MFLSDPQTEGVLHWLIHLTLGIFRPPQENEIDEELKKLTTPQDETLLKELSDLLRVEVAG